MKYITFILASIMAISCGRRIVVYNGSETPRHGEIVEVDLYELSEDGARDFAIFDKDGNEIQSQITFDDKLIFPSDVPAMGKAVYRVEKVIPTEVIGQSDYGTVAPYRVAVMVNGEPLFPNEIDKTEILDDGPLRYTVSMLYFPIPVDTMWVKQRCFLSLDKVSGKISEKVWFEDLKGEHEIMIAKDSLSVGIGSVGIGKTEITFSEPLHDVEYRTFGKLCVAGFCTLDGPSPLEITVGDNYGQEMALEVEICGNGR